MLTAIILSSAIYLQYQGETIRVVPVRTPSLSGLCEQERELARWTRMRVDQMISSRVDLPTELQRENLAVPYAGHDWCAPRYQLRRTIDPRGPVRMILMKR